MLSRRITSTPGTAEQRAHLIEIIGPTDFYRRMLFAPGRWRRSTCASLLRARRWGLTFTSTISEEMNRMIGPTLPLLTAAFFEFTQAGRGLACVENLGPVRPGRFDKLASQAR